MNTRLASYSSLYKSRVSAKAIREAYKADIDFDLQLTDLSPECGRYTSPRELKALGIDVVYVRFNADRDVMALKL